MIQPTPVHSLHAMQLLGLMLYCSIGKQLKARVFQKVWQDSSAHVSMLQHLYTEGNTLVPPQRMLVQSQRDARSETDSKYSGQTW